jgi:dihydropteroate synthase
MPPPRWEARGRSIVPEHDRAPRIMGVVNVTPDSFSDGGRFTTVDGACEQARKLVAEGAHLLDVGGESSRPGAVPVPVEEELRRVIPTLEALAEQACVPISVDTTKLEVARRALEAGASIINDVEGLAGKHEMIRLAADTGAGVVIMHMAGTPQTMQIDPRYDDVVAEVYEFLARQVEAAETGGIARACIAIDPGIGFGKKSAHNLDLLRNIGRFASLGCAVLVGVSRKGFLGKLTSRQTNDLAIATVVSSLAAAVAGASVVRVHDVGPMADAIKVWTAQRGWN